MRDPAGGGVVLDSQMGRRNQNILQVRNMLGLENEGVNMNIYILGDQPGMLRQFQSSTVCTALGLDVM